MASFSTLNDPFIGKALNTNLWTQFTAGSATMSYGNGASAVYPASTTGSTDGDITTIASYDLTSSYVLYQVLATPNVGAPTNTDAQVRLGNTTNSITFLIEAGILYAQHIVATVNTNLASITYNPVTHLWFRFREQSGTTFWETSSDGMTWNIFWSESNAIVLTSLTLQFAGTAFGISVSPGNFTWRYLNTPTSEAPYNHLRVNDGMSRSEVAN